MDQNDSNQTPNTQAVNQPDQQQADTQNTDQQNGQQANDAPQADTQNTDSNLSQTTAPVQATTDTNVAAGQPVNYVQDVGGDMIGLLDEIEEDETLIQEVADEMLLDKEKVKTILTGLLDKIDKEQVTAEEIALIMAAPAVDELTEQPEEGK